MPPGILKQKCIHQSRTEHAVQRAYQRLISDEEIAAGPRRADASGVKNFRSVIGIRQDMLNKLRKKDQDFRFLHRYQLPIIAHDSPNSMNTGFSGRGEYP
jgi:hypothetical protein